MMLGNALGLTMLGVLGRNKVGRCKASRLSACGEGLARSPHANCLGETAVSKRSSLQTASLTDGFKMLGHGRPTNSKQHGRQACGGTFAVPAFFALSLFLAFTTSFQSVRAESVRLRIAWGGGAARLWTGTLTIDQGALLEHESLGIEADEPGSMWGSEDGGRLEIRQRSVRTYDGFDVFVDAPLTAVLELILTPGDRPEEAARFRLPVADLLEESVNQPLDERGNRVLVQRSPGDALRVTMQRTSLVFAPEETFELTVEPHLLPVSEESRFLVKFELIPSRGEQVLWSVEREGRAGQAVNFPLSVPLPAAEGSYDLVMTVTRAGWPNPVRRPLHWRQTVVQRKVQLLVLAATAPRSDGSVEDFRQVVEIDPVHPRWWELLGKLPQLPKVQRLWKTPLGNGNMQRWRHSLGEVVRLNPSRQSPDLSWEAYTLPILEPGRPHVLEVDYPSDVPQTLGISVLEPNAVGALMPIGLDSGVNVEPASVDMHEPPQWRRHRLIFWPRTSSPMVLMTNLRATEPAVYGKIRVLAAGEHLPAADLPNLADGRLWAAYMDRPMLPENFSAQESFDPGIERGLDDWQTFHEGGTRLVEYLRHTGYNGLMLNVLADGSTIYPSRILEPTPRYDTGALFTTAQDPIRKDVLEMLFLLFNRHQLKLVPGLEFGARLPALETVLRNGGQEAEGIEWIGPEGEPWSNVHGTQRGLGAYYNTLHPRVQAAMLDVVREVVGRYAHHPSFAGLAIQLSAHGYAQLPGPDWGLDDVTIARFSSETGTSVPGSGPERFAQRARFLSAEPHRTLWLQWRADRLHDFHCRIQTEIKALRPETQLYLAGAEMLAGDEIAQRLRPALIGGPSLADVMLDIGVHAEHFRKEAAPVLLRAERHVELNAGGSVAAGQELSHMPEFDRWFGQQAASAALFFHPPHKSRVGSFDAKSPFQPSYTSLFTQISPSGYENRRRFANAMANQDPAAVFDGGWLLPMGQESSLQDVMAAYRRLPAVPFYRVKEHSLPSQPVVFCYAHHRGQTYAYAVNNAPFPVEARVRIDAPPACSLEELTGRRSTVPLRQDGRGRFVWEMQLEPFDLIAVRLSAAEAKLVAPEAVIPASIRLALEQRIRSLAQRAAVLRNTGPSPLVENPGFEESRGAADDIPGWAITRNRPGVEVRLDETRARDGKQCVRMNSQGPIGVLVSQPFPMPTTGRVTLAVWLRVADASRQPPLRLALEGEFGRIPYRFASVGAAPGSGHPSVPIGSEWGQFVFHVADLPLEPGRQMAVRFDLMGAGEVFIDDVEVYDLSFNRNEMVELSKHISLLDLKLHNGQLADCLELLGGYWPQFLERHVALPTQFTDRANLADRPTQPRKPQSKQDHSDAGERTSLLDRMRDFVPKKLW